LCFDKNLDFVVDAKFLQVSLVLYIAFADLELGCCGSMERGIAWVNQSNERACSLEGILQGLA